MSGFWLFPTRSKSADMWPDSIKSWTCCQHPSSEGSWGPLHTTRWQSPSPKTLSWETASLPRPWFALSYYYYYYYWSLLYSAILRSRADSLRSHVILHERIVFIARFWISTEVVYLQHWHGWCHKNLLPDRVSLGAFCVHHTTMHRVTSCKATYARCMRV